MLEKAAEVRCELYTAMATARGYAYIEPLRAPSPRYDVDR
jgi:hypothetical protein